MIANQRIVGALAAALLLLPATALPAEDRLITETAPALAVPGRHAPFGTADESVISIADSAFRPIRSLIGYEWDFGTYLTAPGHAFAPLDLPSGAVVTAIEMEGCDTTGVGRLLFHFVRCPVDDDGACYTVSTLDTGYAETPGCAVFSSIPLDYEVDNLTHSYGLIFDNETFDGTTKWRHGRVYYRRQVSPAPGTASFGDVPVGHPLHQFVEALAASGITAGCGGGDFCPNAPITRGQMAVFLAKALGLHWAP